MVQRCCPECFGDRGLKKSIIPSLSPMRGTCSYCGTEAVDLVEPGQLGDYFELLTNIYEPDPRGKLLVEWLKSDWHLFSHPRLDVHAAKALLARFSNDGEIVRQAFSPLASYTSTELDSWEALRDELMYKNRYFPDAPLHASRLGQLLDYLQADELPTKWYRARIRDG